jgi:hypothetical protein
VRQTAEAMMNTRIQGFSRIHTNETSYMRAVFGSVDNAKADMCYKGNFIILHKLGPLAGVRNNSVFTLADRTVFNKKRPMRHKPEDNEAIWGIVLREGSLCRSWARLCC